MERAQASSLALGHLRLTRLDHGLGAIADLERLEDRRDMDLDGALGEIELAGDVLVRHAAGEQTQDIVLAPPSEVETHSDDHRIAALLSERTNPAHLENYQ